MGAVFFFSTDEDEDGGEGEIDDVDDVCMDELDDDDFFFFLLLLPLVVACVAVFMPSFAYPFLAFTVVEFLSVDFFFFFDFAITSSLALLTFASDPACVVGESLPFVFRFSKFSMVIVQIVLFSQDYLRIVYCSTGMEE